MFGVDVRPPSLVPLTLRCLSRSGGRRPVGRRPWMGAVFGRAMDGESENGRSTRKPKLALIGEGPFFWLLFFGPAKKSNSPTAKAFKQRRRQTPHPGAKMTHALPRPCHHPRPRRHPVADRACDRSRGG